MKSLDVFISGELIDLCIPTLEFARDSNWYSWFNSPKITKYLYQGGWPNTPDDQQKFFLSQGSDRLVFIISNKKEYIGVISLSSIDKERKSCDVALVVDSSVDFRMSSYASLEAMARITEHGFKILGMNRISAGQHSALLGWQQRMELLGYKLEGIHKNKFVKGHDVADTVSIACVYEDYFLISNCRGALWDSFEKMKTRIGRLPKCSFSMMMFDFFSSERDSYYRGIYEL